MKLRFPLVLLVVLGGCTDDPVELPPPPHAAPAQEGFTYASPTRPLQFPGDFGAHPAYQTEWWYYTGNLEAEGRHFGYQLTFFRRSVAPPQLRSPRTAALATNEIYMAHFALTDTEADEHVVFEHFSRAGGQLAGATAVPHSVWLDDWRVEQSGSTRTLVAAAEGFELALSLDASQAPIEHGEGGYSRKGSDAKRASHYYTLPRMKTEGSITTPEGAFAVAGLSWMDHEFTSSGLADHQVGWDWFSLQLSNGSSVMLFHLRTEDGGIDPHSSGTWIAADGSQRHLSANDFVIEEQSTWRSPHTGGSYPSRWRVRIPIVGVDLEVEPTVADQEIIASFVYWEGAVAADGSQNADQISGRGYVELTGYAVTMQGAF